MFKPMLAGKADLDKITYPVLATPKIDGIRCIVKDGQTYTRSLKQIPNNHVRETLINLFKMCPYWVDGELVIPNSSFNDTTSLIMRHNGRPLFQYLIFDVLDPKQAAVYRERMRTLDRLFIPDKDPVAKLIPTQINNRHELDTFEFEMINLGYEGVMIRDPQGPYKYGRSTTNEGYLLKIKRFEDSEAVVIDMDELMINGNEAKINALGHTERSSHQANLIPGGKMGLLQVRDLKTGVEFSIGTGFTDDDRHKVWAMGSAVIGQVIKYKYQPHGVKDLPRFPVFLGFRANEDMGE